MTIMTSSRPSSSAVVAVLVLASVLVVAAVTVVPVNADAADDLITNLPGVSGTLPYKQYAGYVTVDAAHDRELFYWLTESQNDPATDPLVLWLNGGPGCSSIGGGLMSELGPLFPDHEGNMHQNPWAWNRIANVIFLESPAGVGFSFSGDKADYTTGDNRTAYDTYFFLQGFLQRFPEFKGRKFWVAGESYGGHYVPQITNTVVYMNSRAATDGYEHINIQGFLVGNAWTDASKDNQGAVFDWWSHAIISDETYAGLTKTCDFSVIGPLMDADSAAVDSTATAETCTDYVQRAMSDMGRINIYDIYVDVCVGGTPPPLQASAEAQHGTHFLRQLGRLPARSLGTDDDPISNTPAGGAIHYDPCIGDAVTKYLNNPAVQKAIHANTTLGYPWSSCSPRVNYSRKDLLTSVIPVYQNLMKAGVDILVYSGDVDGIVPTPGTRSWMRLLNLNVKEPWRPWFVNNQTAGFITRYDGFSFSTIRNAGHMVPYMQPSRAFHMFDSYINGKPF